jgi:DNA gyrase subunit B
MKGLGEMDPDETEATLIHPETRIIRQVTVNDVKAADTIISQLMGDNAIYRKKLLKEHGHEARYTQE